MYPQRHVSAGWSSGLSFSRDCQTLERCDTRFLPTKLVALKHSALEPCGLQDMAHARLQERVYKTNIKDVHELRDCFVDEWDKLDQRIVDKGVGEWRKRL